MLLAGKEPKERDDYDQVYLEHFNRFLMSNRFAKLAQEQKQAVVQFLRQITLRAQRTNMLGQQVQGARGEASQAQPGAEQPPEQAAGGGSVTRPQGL